MNSSSTGDFMATNIGVKIGVDGAAQFKSSLRSVDTELRSLGSELKAATAEFKGNENSQEAVAKKADILARTYDTAEKKVAILTKEYEDQSKKLDELAVALEKAIKDNGENSDEAEKAQKAYDKQKDSVNKLSGQLHSAEADMYNVRNAEKAIGTEADNTTKKTSTFGDTLKAVLTADFIKTGLGAIKDGLVKIGQSVWDTAKETAAYADEVSTLATQYNLTTDQVQEYMYMQDLADVSTETIMGSLTKLTKNMGEAQDGTGDAAAAFDKLGVSIYDSNGELRSSQDVFMDAIDALGQIENATERDTISMALFGKGAQDLNPLIELGAEGFQDLANEAHEAGAVMSGEALQGANEFQDSLDRAKERTEGLKRQIGEKLIPVFGDLLEKVLDWAEGVDWDKVGATIGAIFDGIATAVGAVVTALQNVYNWCKNAIGALQDFADSFRNSGVSTAEMWDYGSVVRSATGGSGTGGGGSAGGGAGRGGAPTNKTNPRQSVLNGVSGMSASTGGTRVVINTQSLSKSDIDYVVAQVNSKLGAYA